MVSVDGCGLGMEERMDGYISVTQAAKELRIVPRVVRYAIQRGALPAFALHARSYVVSRADVERYRREHLRKPRRPGKADGEE